MLVAISLFDIRANTRNELHEYRVYYSDVDRGLLVSQPLNNSSWVLQVNGITIISSLCSTSFVNSSSSMLYPRFVSLSFCILHLQLHAISVFLGSRLSIFSTVFIIRLIFSNYRMRVIFTVHYNSLCHYNIIEQNLYREANSRSGSQEMLRLLWNSKIYTVLTRAPTSHYP